jgi:tetratricopeptide (TPR) repeat protein
MTRAKMKTSLIGLGKWYSILLLIFFTGVVHAQKKIRQEIVLDSLIALNKNAEAINYLQKEIRLKPKDERLIRLMGFMHLYTNDLVNAEADFKKAIAINTACSRCYVNLARIYGSQNNADKALVAINKSIAINDSDATAYAIKASIAEVQNDEFAALINYDKAIAVAPNEAQYYNARAMYNKNHNYASLALMDINKAIALDSNNDAHYYVKSETYFGMGKFKEALQNVNTAITINNKKVNYYIARAAVQSALKKPKETLDDYKIAIALDSNNYFAYYNLGGEYYRQEEMDLACKYLNKSLSIINKYKLDAKEKESIVQIINNICYDNKPSYYYQRGIAFYNLNKLNEAINIYDMGIKKYPTNAMLHTFRGNALIKTKQYKACIDDYEQAILYKNNLTADIKLNNSDIKTIDNSFENEMVASNYSSIAEAYLAIGNFELANVNINKCLAIPSANKVVGKENYFRQKAEINVANNKMEEAITDFDSSLNINSNHVPALIGKATALIYKLNKITSKSLGANLKMSEMPITLQWELPLKLNGKIADATFNEAMGLVQKAIALEENNADAYYIRGVLHYMNFDTKSYCLDIARAKALGRIISEEFEKNCK